MASVGTVIIDVKADTAKLVNGMDRAESTIKRSVSNIQKTILTLATAYAGIQGVRAFKNMIDDSLDAADSTGKLAQKLGLTTDALSEYQYTAKFAAVSSGELNAGLSALIRRLSNFQRTGGGAAKTAFQELGISAEYARKHFTNTDIAFKEILKRLEKMPDGFRKTAIAQDIFSKSASSIMRITSSDLQKFSEEAKKIGISISQSTYNMAAAYHDQMDQIDARMKGFKRTISFSMIAPLDAASKTALTFMDNAFGSDATSRVKGFENITVTAISNIVYSLGFIKDVGTGIELVLDGIKLAFYSLAGVAAVAIEPVRVMINNMIDAYNYLADSLGQDKIGFKLESSLPDIANKIISIKNEMMHLTGELQNGRISAEEYSKKFIANLAKVKEEAKHTKKSIADISKPAETSIFKTKTKELFASQQVWEDYYNKLKDYKTAWLVSDDRSTATTNADLMGLKGADYDKYVNSYKNNYLKKLEDASKKTSKEINYVFTNAFKGMENSLTNFVMTGKMDFNSLANSIISDMVRMSIQQSITKPLTAAFSSAFAGGFGSLFANAHGGAYESASLSQYSNKVIDTPTPFMFANGGVPNLGVFGEAGAEAIMPLTRVGGDLGVKSSPSNVVINIENNSGQEIDASAISEMTRTNERGEQEKVITMVIDGVNRNVKGMRDVLKGIR